MNESTNVGVVRLGGELEIGRKKEIREALAAAADAPAALLDLGEVTYADSIALTELLRFCAGALDRKRPVALVIRTPQFARLVEYAGLAGAFTIFDDAARARAYLESQLR